MASVLDNWSVRRRFGRVQSMVDLVAPHRMDSGRGALPSLEIGAASVRYCRHRLGLRYGWSSVVVLGLLA